MHMLLSCPLVLVLQLWLASAILTLLVHVGFSLAIDRRFVPGLWEQWALALLMALGPLGTCLEMFLVVRVWQDILPQLRCNQRQGLDDNGTAVTVLPSGPGSQ